MKRRITKAIRDRMLSAQKRGHYTKAATIRKQLAVIKSLSVRDVRNAPAS